MAEVEIQNERVDDLPLLIGQQQKLGIGEIIDDIITPHWRRQGRKHSIWILPKTIKS